MISSADYSLAQWTELNLSSFSMKTISVYDPEKPMFARPNPTKEPFDGREKTAPPFQEGVHNLFSKFNFLSSYIVSLRLHVPKRGVWEFHTARCLPFSISHFANIRWEVLLEGYSKHPRILMELFFKIVKEHRELFRHSTSANKHKVGG